MARLVVHIFLSVLLTAVVRAACWHRSLLDSVPKTPPLTEDERRYGRDPEARTRLKERLPAGVHVGPTFREAIDTLNKQPGVTVHCPFHLIEKLGVASDAAVSEDVGGLTAEEALDKVLSAAGAGRVELKCRAVPGCLIVDTKVSAALLGSTDVVYNVQRLLPPRSAPGPMIVSARAALERDVTREVMPDRWDPQPRHGTNPGTLTTSGGQLFVCQTPAVQQEVRRWIEHRIWYANLRFLGRRAVPYGVAVAGVVTAAHLVAWWRRRRSRLGVGRCAACGYDLRATPGRCPECGAVPVGRHASRSAAITSA